LKYMTNVCWILLEIPDQQKLERLKYPTSKKLERLKYLTSKSWNV
jgi:hypothetical protein